MCCSTATVVVTGFHQGAIYGDGNRMAAGFVCADVFRTSTASGCIVKCFRYRSSLSCPSRTTLANSGNNSANCLTFSAEQALDGVVFFILKISLVILPLLEDFAFLCCSA